MDRIQHKGVVIPATFDSCHRLGAIACDLPIVRHCLPLVGRGSFGSRAKLFRPIPIACWRICGITITIQCCSEKSHHSAPQLSDPIRNEGHCARQLAD